MAKAVGSLVVVLRPLLSTPSTVSSRSSTNSSSSMSLSSFSAASKALSNSLTTKKRLVLDSDSLMLLTMSKIKKRLVHTMAKVVGLLVVVSRPLLSTPSTVSSQSSTNWSLSMSPSSFSAASKASSNSSTTTKRLVLDSKLSMSLTTKNVLFLMATTVVPRRNWRHKILIGLIVQQP